MISMIRSRGEYERVLIENFHDDLFVVNLEKR